MIFYRVIDKHSHIFLRDGIDFDEKTEIGIVTEPFEGMLRAKWDFNKEAWVETITPEERMCLEYGASSIGEALSIVKEEKISELRIECNQRITEGFSVDGEHYSYNQDNQINFQDTYQLFLNNMIAEIAWNAYVDGEKTRVLLDKDKFQRVYLAGVKHKQDCIIHLNDILIPLVESFTEIESLKAISWGEQKSSFRISDEKNIAKKVEGLSEDFVAQKSINEQVESIVLEIADIAISGF